MTMTDPKSAVSADVMALAGELGAERSRPGWSAFSLDTTAAGAVFKPDSMFMEVRRPL